MGKPGNGKRPGSKKNWIRPKKQKGKGPDSKSKRSNNRTNLGGIRPASKRAGRNGPHRKKIQEKKRNKERNKKHGPKPPRIKNKTKPSGHKSWAEKKRHEKKTGTKNDK